MQKIARPRQVFDLVEIIWDDAAAHENVWMDKIDALKPHLIHSVGFLVLLDKKYAVIAQDCDEEGQHNGRTQIPKGQLVSMKVLRKKD